MKRNYANVMATIAMFIALGGSAYAATSLTGRDIQNNTLTGVDVRKGSLGTSDIKNGELLRRDFRAGSLPRGTRGATGATGPQGPAGQPGASGATSRWLLVDESGDIAEQSGGFTVLSKPGINGQPATNPNVYVSAGSSLVGKGLTGTIAIQNRIDRTGDMVADPAFNGNVAVGRCNTAAINCVPAGTNADNVLVVRALVDNTDATSQTRRVYVEVTS
jgi:hypothetical protein